MLTSGGVRVLFLRSSSLSRARQKPAGEAPRAQVDVRSNNLNSIPHYPRYPHLRQHGRPRSQVSCTQIHVARTHTVPIIVHWPRHSRADLALRRFNQQVLVDTTPLPDNIPKVKEIGASSAPLLSASFFIGARCKPYNDDYMMCKTEANGTGELDCMKEGRKVTRCATSV